MKNKSMIVGIGCVLLVILVLAVIRTSGHQHFRPNANKYALPSYNGSNMIKASMLNQMERPLLIVLDDSIPETKDIRPDVLHISPENILESKNIQTITDHKGSRILVSTNTDVSARIWMILSQTGIKDLYILAQ